MVDIRQPATHQSDNRGLKQKGCTGEVPEQVRIPAKYNGSYILALIKDRPISIRNRLSLLTPEEVGISSMVAAELWFGVANSQKKKKNESALKDLLPYWIGLARHLPFMGRFVRSFKKRECRSVPWIC